MTLTPRLVALMSLPPLLWAGNAVVGRWIAGGAAAGQGGAALAPPLTMNLMRWLLTAAILLPLAWRALRPVAVLRARWPYLLALGTLSVGLYNALQYLALVTSSPLNVTLVAASMPVWMLAVGRLGFGEPVHARQWAGAALGMAGVAVVVSRGVPADLLAVRLVRGDVAILVAVVGWAVYSWLLARPPAPMRGAARPPWDWAGFLLVQVAFGLPSAVLFAAAEQAGGAPPVRWSWSLAAALVYVSVGASLLAYRAWGAAVARAGPAMAAFFGNLTPLITALLSALLLGEHPQAYHALAFACIVGGIAISTPRGGTPQRRPTGDGRPPSPHRHPPAAGRRDPSQPP